MSRSILGALPGLEAIRRLKEGGALLFGALSALDGQVRRANASAGRVTLVEGRALVETGVATSEAEFFFQVREERGTAGDLVVGVITEGRSFELLSSSATDVSVVSWCVRFPS